MIKTKRFLCLLLVLTMAIGLAVPALAKTDSAELGEPQSSAIVFSISVGSLNVHYTWADITGASGTFKTKTLEYPYRPDEGYDGAAPTMPWTGVMLADILKDVEKQTGVTLADSYYIKTVTADNYVSAFTVADLRDSSERYMVAAEAVSNGDYANSYVRILRGTETSTPNQANLRCVLGIDLTADANGTEIATPKAKTQGGDAQNAYFYIAVKESASSGYKMYYYTLEELMAYDDIHSFTYTNHGFTQTTNAKGVYLKSLLEDITDAVITDNMIIQYAEQDGYHADANTAIEESVYKDKVGWLENSHLGSGGETIDAKNTVIAYGLNIQTEAEEEGNHPDGVYYWAEETDMNYLRAYKQGSSSNDSTYKMLMGVVVSYDGQQLTGKDGYSLTAMSANNEGTAIKEYSAVTGLVPGMTYVVKAPLVTNGTLAAGQPTSKTITVGSGATQKIEFVYDESPYFTVTTANDVIEYVYTDFLLDDLNAQIPSKEAGQKLMDETGGSVYGFNNNMLYRYYGAFLSDLIGDVTGEITITTTGTDTLTIDAKDAGDYFVAYGTTQSRGQENTAEGKRALVVTDLPFIIKPSDESLVCVNDSHVIVGGTKKDSAPTKLLENVVGALAEGAAGLPFTDLGNYSWARAAIAYLYGEEIVFGTSANTFSPANNLKRGDFILMLYRAYGFEGTPETEFADVPVGSYYAEAISAAKANGIAQGDGVNFNPEGYISRQDAMTLISRTMEVVDIELEETNDLSEFADAGDVADYALEAVQKLVAAGVINGNGGKILPGSNMTRAEMAVALYRALMI